MLECKTFEIRDRATFIPAVAINCDTPPASKADHYLLRRSGYGPDCRCILLTRLGGGRSSHFDPHDWGDRTWNVAHAYIHFYWDMLKSGDVVDVEFILGENKLPKVSERLI